MPAKHPIAIQRSLQNQLSKLRHANVPWALVTSAFINKSGELALSLLPMLLIERNISNADSSLILGTTKAAQVSAYFCGGLFSDLFGFRIVILAAYFLSFIGFISLPFLRSEWLIGGFSILAQFGSSLFPPSSRSMIRQSKQFAMKTSIAWLRTASNLGQVVSSLLGIVLGPLGLIIPFLIDGATSLVAFVVAFFTLKNPKVEATSENTGRVEKGFFLYSFGLAFFFFIYELGFLSVSGFAKLSLGDQGIRAVGVVLFINALLCGVCAVPAARFFHKPLPWLPVGFSLVTAGMLTMTLLPKTILFFALCSLLMTIGEVIFSVHAQTLLLANSHGKSSRHFGLSLMIQALGRLGAGLAVFPLVLRSTHPSLPFLIAPLGFFLMLLVLPREFIRRGASAS